MSAVEVFFLGFIVGFSSMAILAGVAGLIALQAVKRWERIEDV